MKTIKTLLLMVAITFSTVLFAGTTPKTEEPSNLTKEISELLKNARFEVEQDVEAIVTITFNKYDEIVVLSVETENSEFKKFIKDRLNYSKVSAALINESEHYIVPVRLTKK